MTDTQTPRDTTAKGRYATLSSERIPFLRRAEDAARLTIPSLLPPEGHTNSSTLFEPYQSVGARGVNNLAAKSVLALYPPGSSFFRLSLSDKVQDELTQKFEGDSATDARTKLEAALGKMENSVLKRMERTGARAPLYDAHRHLFVAGNVLVQVLDNGGLRNHYLNSYVVKRDPEGTPTEIIVKECFSRATVTDAIEEILHGQENEQTDAKSISNVVEVYTHLTLEGKVWKAYQEVLGKRIPNTEGSYPQDKCPFIPLRFSRIEGESYGRGLVEEYMGDMRSLEALTQSLVEIAGIAANVKFLIDPAGITKKAVLARSKNGALVDGQLKDVGVLSLEKFQDFKVAKEVADGIEQRLGEAFLLGTAAVRDAERVTAEEIRLIAGELEQALGGFYSVLAVELQYPLVSRLVHIMTQDGTLPKLPEGSVTPSIVTGLEALGRGGDLAKLDTLLAGISQLFGQAELEKAIKVNEYILRRSTALGIDVKGLVRTDEEVAAINQQQTAKELVGKLGPTALRNQQLNNPEGGQSAAPGAEPAQG